MVLPGNWKLNILLVLTLGFSACEETPKEKKRTVQKPVKTAPPTFYAPDFNADSAYAFIEKQVAFGPRVPNTDPHRKTGDWLISKMGEYGLTVNVQAATVTAFNNDKLNIRNITASHQPENPNRILLFAHWDTRPFADQDNERVTQPIPGANDGGSGVGVLIEIARQLAQKPTTFGIDIIFFDGEDYGQPEGTMIERKPDTYCLGSQYWSNTIGKSHNARYGILLDMVGAEGAEFTKEGTSMYYAAGVVNKVWQIASQLGYGNHFINRRTEAITDDHLYVNSIAGIPSIDIIQYDPNTPSNFGEYWHTHDDDMSIISKTTLKAVGQTVLETIYREGK